MAMELRGGTIAKVRLTTRTSTGVPLYVELSEDGLDIFVTESSSRYSHDKPICLSIDDIWEIVKDKSGGRVALKDRAVVKRALAKSSS